MSHTSIEERNSSSTDISSEYVATSVGTLQAFTPASAATPALETMPRLELPKGGGAIRGIGETFRVNAVNGTTSLSLPLPASPARTVNPDLNLTYDSGNGAGPFGWGWTHDLPSIRRKTERGLPRYFDNETYDESDVFQLSGREDLVALEAAGRPAVEQRDGYSIRRYAPRIEGSFLRIERWTRLDNAEQHWRVTSSGNTTSVFGSDGASRIAGRPLGQQRERVFAWLLRERFDDRGNRLIIDYKREDGAGVSWEDAAEWRPADDQPSQLYPKRVRYGNRTPGADDFAFEVVFDYGEHPDETPGETVAWKSRLDPFSTYRAGFEIRTRRLCQRVLLFHRFPDELQEPVTLVRALSFGYRKDRAATLLTSATSWSYARKSTGERVAQSVPPLEFGYSLPPGTWAGVKPIEDESLENLPAGLDDASVQWVDLFGDALPGALTELADGWTFKPNLSPLRDGKGRGPSARLGAVQILDRMPRGVAAATQFLDIDGDGKAEAVSLDTMAAGFIDPIGDAQARPFTPFRSAPRIDWANPNLRLIDLTGDGLPDVVITEQDQVLWYASLGAEGFAEAAAVAHGDDEEKAAAVVFRNGEETIFTADMSGDGLSDLVRIRAREICYWPNLGYGRFGPKRIMAGVPDLEVDAPYDPCRVRLVDTDGSGTTDLVYLGASGWSVHVNCTGTRYAAGRRLEAVPHFDSLAKVMACDLLGNGMACLVWSSRASDKPMRYLSLAGEVKPYLLTSVRNNLGAETAVSYAASTSFLLADRLAGRPWVTSLPFSVNVVERIETRDLVNGQRFRTRYAYHHGYFDRKAREFRGFGCVEQWDTEEQGAYADNEAGNFAAASSVPPVLTRRWYHTGAPISDGDMAPLFARDYFGSPASTVDASVVAFHRRSFLASAVLPPGLATQDWREACRALKGTLIREEIYGLDGSAASSIPYAINQHGVAVAILQSARDGRHGIALVAPRESMALHTERSIETPRVVQDFTLKTDAWGNVLKSASIAFGRAAKGDGPAIDTQSVLAEIDMTNAIGTPACWRTPLVAETRSFEFAGTGISNADWPLAFDVVAALASAATELSPTDVVNRLAPPQKRLLGRSRTRYRRDDLTGPANWGELQPLALPYDSHSLMFTAPLAARLFNGAVDAALMAEGGYTDLDGDNHYWASSGRIYYQRTADHPEGTSDPAGKAARAAAEKVEAKAHFFLPRAMRDPFGQHGFVDYDAHSLLPISATDRVGNIVRADYDYRLLAPRQVIDPNGNRRSVAFDVLGRPVAIAVAGKDGEAVGEVLADRDAYLTPPSFDFLAIADPAALQAAASMLLGPATSRALYDADAFAQGRGPNRAVMLARQMHTTDLPAGQASRVEIGLSYSDGMGREIQRRAVCEAGPIEPGSADVPLRWIVSGWTVFNNKGAPIRQYQPFFRAGSAYEPDRRVGVSTIVFYDPLIRRLGALRPDGSLAKVSFDAWQQTSFDANDTVRIDAPETDPDIGAHISHLDPLDRGQTWYARRIGGARGPLQQQAAQKAEAHRDTPGRIFTDALGRTVVSIADLLGTPVRTVSAVDLLGLERETHDALDRLLRRRDYDLVGRLTVDESLDGGTLRTLPAIDGAPIRIWDSRGHVQRLVYDAARRPLDVFITEAGVERLRGRKIYGETQGAAQNLRGREYQTYDSTGLLTSLAYDFKGNLVRSRRQLATDYRGKPDWKIAALEAESFDSSVKFDAMGRQIQFVAPRSSNAGTPINIAQPTYNDAGLLTAVSVWLGAATQPGELLDPATATRKAVEAVTYNANRQRTSIGYGNGVTSHFRYDPETYRLVSLTTTRGAAFPSDQPGGLQALNYTYDPVGNITHITDEAQPTIIFAGAVVEPKADYVYDSLYRLTKASGREHRGTNGKSWPTAIGSERWVSPIPTDPQVMRNYTQDYTYDLVGNLKSMSHVAGLDGWTRTYVYDEGSPFEAGKFNNRLSRTEVGSNGVPEIEAFGYDAHGNITKTSRLQAIAFDDQDRLLSASLGGGGRVFYAYDSGGQRTRKVVERLNASGGVAFIEERIYLGGFELFRRRRPDGTITRERETLRVIGGGGALLDVETRNFDADGNDPAPARAFRWQFGNHLGSAVLELDEAAAIVSYEEYHPFGSTSLGAMRSLVETPKRYRYTGKERDDESGFYYHGARYYMPWNGRWTACDPAGLADGMSGYVAWRCNPIRLVDPSGTMSKEAQAAWDAARHSDNGMSPDQIAAVYQKAEDVPKQLVEPAKPSVSRVLQQQRRLAQGNAKHVQDKADAAKTHRVTKEEKWQAAKAGGRNWLLDRAAQGLAGPAPGAKEVLQLALKPLRAPEPVAHPTNVAELEIKENYEGMQTTLTVAETAVMVVAPMIGETALETLAPELAGGGGVPPIEPPAPPAAPATPLPRMSDTAIIQSHTNQVYSNYLVNIAEQPGAYELEQAANRMMRPQFGNAMQSGVAESMTQTPGAAGLYERIQQPPGVSVPDYLHTGGGTGRPFVELTTTNPATIADHANRWYAPYSDLVLYPPLPPGLANQTRLQNWMQSRGIAPLF